MPSTATTQPHPTSSVTPRTRNWRLGLGSLILALTLGCFTSNENIGEDSRWIALALSAVLAAAVAFSPIFGQLAPLWQAGRKAMKKKKGPLTGLLLLVICVTFGFGFAGPSGIVTVGSLIVAFRSLGPQRPPVPLNPPPKVQGPAAAPAPVPGSETVTQPLAQQKKTQ